MLRKTYKNGVTVPVFACQKKLLMLAHLEPSQTLVITLKGKSIVLTPVRKATYFTLATMLKDVTPENVHGEFDWGVDVGAERVND